MFELRLSEARVNRLIFPLILVGPLGDHLHPLLLSAARPAALIRSDPVKVFDNLYFVGQSEYSASAVTTSAGIIVIDTVFDYSVQAAVVEGLTQLGLDPKQTKYARS